MKIKPRSARNRVCDFPRCFLQVDRLVLANKQWNRAWGKAALLSCLLAWLPVAAQVVNDSATNTISGGTTTFPGDVTIGTNAPFTVLILTNNAVLTNGGLGIIGYGSGADSNAVIATGSGTRWLMGGNLLVGKTGAFNGLVISSGALVANSFGILGNVVTSSSNEVLVTGADSYWSNRMDLRVGDVGNGNRLVISNGARVGNERSFIGRLSSSSNNEALVTGTGSFWSNRGNLFVGNLGSGSRLTVSSGGTVFAGTNVYLGFGAGSVNNLVLLSAGTLRVTNASATGALDIRSGTNQLNSGLVETDVLLVTNTLGLFEFNGGTFNVRNSSVANARMFFVGNGSTAATLNLVGNGIHSFEDGLTLRAKAFLTGNGSITGAVSVLNGATLAPGISIGKIVLSNPPSLAGTNLMEISKNGSALTNDQVQVNGLLTYGGTLTVSDIGPDALTLGDRFSLFNASSYAGDFSSLTLPLLASGLDWTNKLLVDGSIEVVAEAARPRFSNVNRSGTNVVISGTGGPTNGTYFVMTSTNVALPLINWTHVLTNQFDSSGNFIFTNAISPGEPQRFYALQVHLGAAATVFFSYGTGGTGSTTVSGVGGSTWKTKTDLTSSTIGSVPATWKDEGFDDSAWVSLTTQTGYGDVDENQTFVRVDYDSGTANTQSGPSYLFRNAFTIPDLNAVASVTGEVKYDDGAVVYVNGTEILRTTNLAPGGTLTNYADFNGAATTENATTPLNVPLNLLHNGVNTITVEIHQHDTASLDVTFDLKLHAN